MAIRVSSPSFEEGRPIPRQHTGDGEDRSPSLRWEGAPAGTREFALIVDDPDAPTPKPWVHWVLYGIAPTRTGLPEGFHGGQVPVGQAGLTQGKNSWGTIGYRGPAPPPGHGTHHYRFTLHALNKALALKSGLDKELLLAAITPYVLDQGTLVGVYAR